MSTNNETDALHAAAIRVESPPEVRVEQASDEDPDVFIEGTAFHAGLNQNAWGLTEQGAEAVAETLRGRDFTASHPPLREGRYDRSVFGGQGAPIGEVVTTEVVSSDQAMLTGGGYTARYTAQVKDPDAKAKYQAGLLTGEDYGVSVGIYGNPDEAVCSVCRNDMTECDHERFEEVETGDGEASDDAETEIAGPLYEDAVSDHLAAVYFPAYDGATADVNASQTVGGDAAATATASQVPSMDALAASYGTRAPSDAGEASEAPADAGAAERGDTTTSAWTATAVAVASVEDVTAVRIETDSNDCNQ